MQRDEGSLPPCLGQCGTITTLNSGFNAVNALKNRYKNSAADGAGPTRSGVRRVTVGDDDAGVRVDNFVARALKGVPRSRIYRLLRRGEVRVNGGRAKPARRLEAGDEVRLPPVAVASEPKAAARPRDAAWLKAAVVYDDDRLLVVAKPSGLAVHGGSGIALGLIETLRALRPDAPYLELVHRLDRSTSGCLVVAKRRSELRRVHALLREGAVDKRYLALVRGRWELGAVVCDAPLATWQRKSGERTVGVDADGKAAQTAFSLVQSFPEASLVEARPLTGRTHQIRVHAAYLGHPLAGDARYGDAAFDKAMQALGLERLFLHASSLAFERADGSAFMASAPLPADLRDVLNALEARPRPRRKRAGRGGRGRR